MANDLKIKQADAQQCKAQKNDALHRHHTGLKFKDFKLSVSQLTQGGEVQGHVLDGTVGVRVMRPTLGSEQNKVGYWPQQGLHER